MARVKSSVFVIVLLDFAAQESFEQVNLSASLCADPISQTSMFWIVGQESAIKDDAPSKVSCPGELYFACEYR